MDSETKAYLNEGHNLKLGNQDDAHDEGPNAPVNPLAANSVFSNTQQNPLTSSAFGASGNYYPPT
jgi:hypothetical protein